MSVDLLPQELGFKRPFDHEVTEVLKLSNPNSAPVAFKVKTTAPKQYCVRPNSGTIQPNGFIEVQVLLQAMKEDPPLDAKCRDKFLVQSVLLNASDSSENIASIWQNVEKNSKTSIQERKIRVNFLPPGGAIANGVHDEQPPAYSSPSPQFGSPTPAAAATSEKVASASAMTGEKSGVPSASAAEPSSLSGTLAAASSAVPTSTEELKQQLATANAQITKLSAQLADPQFRQRKIQEVSDKAQVGVQQMQESGVPVQIVAGLCLLCFLIAYLFF